MPGASLLLLSLLARPDPAPDRPSAVCAETVTPIVVDGSVEEWDRSRPIRIREGAQVLRLAGSTLGNAWSGEADASATLWAAFGRADLFLAGEVRDDVHVEDPQVWWRGDAIEVFLRLSPDEASQREPTAEDLQLFLLPLSEKRPWGVAIGGGRRAPGDGGFVGVRVAGRPFPDGRGYSFEAAIPLVNLPGFPQGRGRIGWNAALDDADDPATGTDAYLAWWNPGDAPAADMRVRGWLETAPRLEPAIGARPSRVLEDLVFAGVVFTLLAGLFALAARAQRGALAKGSTVVGILAALGLSVPLSSALVRAIESSRERGFREDLRRVARVLDAAAAGEAGSLEGSAGPANLVRLFRGETIAPRRRWQFTFPPFHPATAPEEERLASIPFLRYRVPLRPAESVAVDLDPPRPAGAIHVALTPEVSALASFPRGGRVVARLEYADGAGESFDLDLGRGERRDSFGGSGSSSELFVRFLDGARRLARVAFEAAPGGEAILEGVTLSFADGYDPLLLGAPTASGIATRIRGPHPGKALVLEPEPRAQHEWDVAGRTAERIFLVYGERPARGTGASAASFRGYGASVVQGVVEFVDGPALRFELQHGADLHASDLDRARHSPEENRGVEVAFVWEEGGVRRHLDVRPVDLQGSRRVRRILFQNTADPRTGYAVEVREVVLATTRSVPPPAAGSPIAPLPEGLRLGDAARAELAGLRFGFADAIGRPAPDAAGEPWLRASREEVEELFAGAAPPRPELRDEPGEGGLWRGLLPIREGTRPAGALVVSRADPGVIVYRGIARATPKALAFLLAPFLVVAAAERLARGRRLRTKLAGAFFLSSAAPLLLFAFGFADLYGRREEEIERERLEVVLRAARERIAIGVEEIDRTAARLAESFLADPRVQERLASPDGPAAPALREALGRTRRAVLGDLEGSFARVEAVGARPGGGAGFVVADGDGAGALEGTDLPVSDLYRLWGEHCRVGLHRARDGDRAFLFHVGAPLLPSPLEESAVAGEGGLRVFSREGLPIAPARLAAESDRSPALASGVRRLAALAARRGGVVCEPWTEKGVDGRIAVDLLRDREGSTVAVLAAFAPSPEPAWTVAGMRVRTRGAFLALAASFAFAAIVVARVLTGRITRPVERLERGARALERGEAVAVEAETEDEIGRLTRTFNRMAEELRRRLEHLSALNRTFRDLASRLDPAGVAAQAVALFREQGGASRVRIAVCEPGAASETRLYGEGGAAIVAGSRLVRAAVEGDEGIRLREGGGAPLAWLSGPDAWLRGCRGVLLLPLRVGSRRLGAAMLGFERGLPEREEFLHAAAAQVAVALENARLYRDALEDPETGALHAAAFLRRLVEEIERAPGRAVGVAKFAIPPDPDGAERDGVPGVRAVRALVRATRGRLPVGRTRPDELALLLPGADRVRAARFAERVRRALARNLGAGGGAGPAESVDAAAAAYPADGASGEFLLLELDRALRRARASRGPVTLPGEADSTADAEPGSALVARADAMQDLLATVERIAPSDLPVLLQGETGVGKEVLADAIHRGSPRRDGPLVKVNCAAIPENLLESELFGHERGAYTGAERRRLGRFEQANGGTLFLDEVGELPGPVQAKLLRTLQEKEVTRLGADRPLPVDVRILAATNRDLRREVAEGRFRPDLFYRLNAVSLLVPPLRERREDIPALVRLAIRRANEQGGVDVGGATPEALDRLYAHPWPGNVRELFNVIGRACVLRRTGNLVAADLGLEPGPQASGGVPSAGGSDDAIAGELNPRQRTLLAFLAGRGWITTREYVDRTGVSERTGLRDLADLVDRGILIRVGSRRGATYRLSAPRGTGTE